MLYPDHQTASLIARQRQVRYEQEKALARCARPLIRRRRQERRQHLRALHKALFLALRAERI